MFKLEQKSLKNLVSACEWEVRVNLAACYRMVSIMGWDDLIHTHISAKIPNTEHYLVNAYGWGFDEVTASSLVKVDLDGNVIGDNMSDINPAGFTIHSAVHEARPDVMCVLHLHTNETATVASQKCGLLPYSQYSMFSLNSLSYHSYEGLAVDEEERVTLQNDLGSHNHMLLINHGALTVGPTIGDAFMRMYDLQRACEIQIMMQSTGQQIMQVNQSILDDVARQQKAVNLGKTGGVLTWPSILRRVHKKDASFAS